ncbi:RNA-directed DNA polymerase, eukaryota, reverse transcriptase zinc-binding domain protein [Tanacetum coccineum]
MKGWNIDMIAYYKQRKAQLVDRGKDDNSGNEYNSKEVDDVYTDDTDMAECMEKDDEALNRTVGDKAWIMMGDMNLTLSPNEHSVGGCSITSDMNEFKECVNSIKMDDIANSSLFFTWKKNMFNAKSGNTTIVLMKLNIVMGNEEFIDKFSQAHDIFLPYLIFDHCPTIIVLPNSIQAKRRAFKFANFVADKQEFLPTLKLKEIQSKIDRDPYDDKLRHEESKYLQENNAYFHKVLKSRNHKSRINYIRDNEGNMFHGEEVANQFVKHFQISLEKLVLDICDEEIKEDIFQIDNNKDPTPDGFPSLFLKKHAESSLGFFKLATSDAVTKIPDAISLTSLCHHNDL